MSTSIIHDADPSGVYLVMVFKNGNWCMNGIFSTAERAQNWMAILPAEYNFLCAPFVIDNPEAGMIGN